MGEAAAIVMGISSLLSGGATLYGASADAEAARAQGEYQKEVADTNARIADVQATDAITRGEKDANLVGRKTKEIVGAQRAALGASGVDVNSGSAVDVQSDTKARGAADELTIRNNAWREAWGYKVESQNATKAGQYAQMAGENTARTTILTGGLNALGYGLKGAGYLAGGFGGGRRTGADEGLGYGGYGLTRFAE
jgi:hypothetical protein